MAGFNRTAKLKFVHPGLATTADARRRTARSMSWHKRWARDFVFDIRRAKSPPQQKQMTC
jgi:hypothetical protein